MLPGKGSLNTAPGPFSQSNMALRCFVSCREGVEEKLRVEEVAEDTGEEDDDDRHVHDRKDGED